MKLSRIIDIELNDIGESMDTLNHLRGLLTEYGNKIDIYIQVNRIAKKGWILYTLQAKGAQITQTMGLGQLERLFDSPITFIKEHLNEGSAAESKSTK